MQLTAAPSTIGGTVTGVDLTGSVDDETAEFLRAALADRGVLVCPGQPVDDEAQQRVAALWADVAPHPILEFLGGAEPMSVVFNDADHPPRGEGDTVFHTDYSFNGEVPRVAVLRATVIPPVGGATTWSDTRAAWADVSDPDRATVRNHRAHHDMGPGFARELEVRFGPELTERVVERFGPGVDHPMVVRHPHTGDELLYVNPGFTRHVVDMAPDESADLLARLFALCAEPHRTFTHQWRPDDLVIWDEQRTVHRGPADFAPHARELRRCTAGRWVPTA